MRLSVRRDLVLLGVLSASNDFPIFFVFCFVFCDDLEIFYNLYRVILFDNNQMHYCSKVT